MTCKRNLPAVDSKEPSVDLREKEEFKLRNGTTIVQHTRGRGLEILLDGFKNFLSHYVRINLRTIIKIAR